MIGDNRLLAQCCEADLGLLSEHLKSVDLRKGDHLASTGLRPKDIFFPTSGVAVEFAECCSRGRAGVDVLGREGVSASHLLLHPGPAYSDTVMISSGVGYSIGVKHLQAAIEVSFSLQSIFLQFCGSTLKQIVETSVSNATQSTVVRLARFLLLCVQRIDDSDLPLTHEEIGAILAVRRASVTQAMHRLEGEGFIRSRRASTTIKDGTGLRAFVSDPSSLTEKGRLETRENVPGRLVEFRGLINLGAPKRLSSSS